MENRQMLELLEDRKLLSGKTVPQLTLAPNTLTFNAVTQSNTSTDNASNGSDSGGPHMSTYQLRVKNSSAKRVAILDIRVRGADEADFELTDFPASGQSFAVGKQINYNVQFTADSTVGIKNAFLIVDSTDPNYPAQRVPLRALVTAGEGTTYEPSLQTVFNYFQLGINAGEQITSANPYFVPSGSSDEVDVQTLVAADPSKPVEVAALAEFTNHADPDVRMGFYTPGQLGTEQYLWYSPSASSQSVSPLIYGQETFNPGTTPFGLVTQYPDFQNPDNTVRNVYSENALNKSWDNTSLVHMKFYPYINSAGTTVPNDYIVAEEEYNQDNVSDSQDLVFIVTNVQPANATPTLSVKNTLGYPSNDILPFNVAEHMDANVGNNFRTNDTLTISNSGTSSDPLTYTASISGTDASDFAITGGGSGSLAAGGVATLGVKFQATSGERIHTATLTITSNDPAHTTEIIALKGYWQQYSEQAGPGQPSEEPTAQQIVNGLLGFGNPIPDASGVDNQGGPTLAPGEISASYFQAADTSAQVRVTDLSNFHSEAYQDNMGAYHPTTSYFDWYVQGHASSPTQIFADQPYEGQMVLPLSAGTNGGTSTSNVAGGHFNPGTQIFGLAVEPNMTKGTGEYSDPTLNSDAGNKDSMGVDRIPASQFGHLLRFFPAEDENGVVIPNTYIVLHDYSTSTTNFDFNDEIYLISNIIPVGQVKTPRTVYSQATSGGNLINFTSPDDGPMVTGFNIYRSTSPDPTTFTLLTTAGRHPSTSYLDTSATPGTTYYYAIASAGVGGTESQRVVTEVVG